MKLFKSNLKISNECLADALDANLSQSDIARMCNVSRQAIHSRINYKPSKKISNRLKMIRYLHKLGFTPTQMRNIIGYKSTNSVYRNMDKLGLERKKKIQRR